MDVEAEEGFNPSFLLDGLGIYSGDFFESNASLFQS